jgi:dTMP kinase
MTAKAAKAAMAKARPGRFVTFEGGDGAGKTTQTRRLARRLRDERGEQVLVTREPGGSLIGNGVRALLVSRAATGRDVDERLDVLEMLQQRFEAGVLGEDAFTAYHALLLAPGNVRSPMTEALLHFAARTEHWEFALKPMLAKYPWVICDRFADSTMAYQGYAGGKNAPGVGRERIELLARAAIPGVKPDLTFMMDLEPEVGLERASARRGDTSSYELLDLDYHRRVREGFLDIAARDPKRCKVIDASQSEDAVAAAIWREIEAFLGPRRASA